MSKFLSFSALGVVVFFAARLIWKIFYAVGRDLTIGWYNWRDRKAIADLQK